MDRWGTDGLAATHSPLDPPPGRDRGRAPPRRARSGFARGAGRAGADGVPARRALAKPGPPPDPAGPVPIKPVTPTGPGGRPASVVLRVHRPEQIHRRAERSAPKQPRTPEKDAEEHAPVDRREQEQQVVERNREIELAAGRTQVIPNPRLCKALIDRLTDQAHIITTGADSYRFRRTVAQRRGSKS